MIEKYKTAQEIKEIVKRLENSPMTQYSHGYEKYGAIKIICAAKKQAENFKHEEGRNAAIIVMEVVLAAHRDFKKQVEANIQKVREKYPSLTFKKLNGMLDKMDYEEFKDVWGHKDQEKYNTLKALVEEILKIQKNHPKLNDFETMKMWTEQADRKKRQNDCLGRIRNVGLATFQHFRIAFGVDTVKPDKRVREVLDREFGAKLSDKKAIDAVEEIAKIIGYKVIEIDQIFVKYGSGYYLNSK